jgi:hypothetical protein
MLLRIGSNTTATAHPTVATPAAHRTRHQHGPAQRRDRHGSAASEEGSAADQGGALREESCKWGLKLSHRSFLSNLQKEKGSPRTRPPRCPGAPAAHGDVRARMSEQTVAGRGRGRKSHPGETGKAAPREFGCEGRTDQQSGRHDHRAVREFEGGSETPRTTKRPKDVSTIFVFH